MRALTLPCLLLLSLLSACSGWPGGPDTYNPVAIVASHTPRVQTPTPLVLSPTPLIVTPEIVTPSETPAPTAATPSVTATTQATATPASVRIDILGCDTGVDILHGMGEVTNAYVTISNPTGSDLDTVCATLRGLDEGRPHPDKTKCIPTLPAGYQVTFKLTVDTTYKQATPIQVDVTTGGALLARLGEPACEAIGLLAPEAGEMGVLRPISTP